MFEKAIPKKEQNGFGYSSFAEMAQKSEHFKKGVSDFKEGKVEPQAGVKAYWVKKRISQRDWSNFYSHGSYCNLGAEGTGKNRMLKIGFLAADQIPAGCEECNDEELRQIDDYCRAYNIRPRPLDDIEQYD